MGDGAERREARRFTMSLPMRVLPRQAKGRELDAHTRDVSYRGLYFLADATVNIEPSAEDLAEIALCAAQEARRFDIEPRVAMLSFSSFGSTRP